MVTTSTRDRTAHLDPVPEHDALVVVRPGVHGRTADGDILNYEPGDRWPDERDTVDHLPKTSWANWGRSKLVPVDSLGEMVEGYSPPAALRRDEETNVEAALADYRRSIGVTLTRTTVVEVTCEVCGRAFDGPNARDRLNGHLASHAKEAADEAADEADDEAAKDAASAGASTDATDDTDADADAAHKADTDAIGEDDA